jgi:hypothetical protein
MSLCSLLLYEYFLFLTRGFSPSAVKQKQKEPTAKAVRSNKRTDPQYAYVCAYEKSCVSVLLPERFGESSPCTFGPRSQRVSPEFHPFAVLDT